MNTLFVDPVDLTVTLLPGFATKVSTVHCLGVAVDQTIEISSTSVSVAIIGLPFALPRRPLCIQDPVAVAPFPTTLPVHRPSPAASVAGRRVPVACHRWFRM